MIGSQGFAVSASVGAALIAILGTGPLTVSAPVAAQTGSLRTEFVAPTQIDPASSAALAPHYVAFDPAAAPRGELFVFLQGFLATPADATLIVDEAATQGFHAIGLAYAKPANVPPLCQVNPDESCFESVRRAVIYGDASPFAEVAPADSMVNQLGKLLASLAAQHPDEGWGAYLDDGAPEWSAIRLGGHSEGGTHATLIARDHDLARLCVFESPVDLVGPPNGLRHLAPWISARGATPADRIYGFRHVHTSSTSWPAFEGAWGLLGLDTFGPLVDVDTVAPPYNGSHHLTTDAAPAVSDDTPNLTHRSVVEDRLTPKTASGAPLFAPVWQYACLS
ncbi:MAG TPA: hypothetical protein VFC51_00490 [Chloroflexota bacterium]|nr:hypothetical protein [Chloroflexota bacterium]